MIEPVYVLSTLYMRAQMAHGQARHALYAEARITIEHRVLDPVERATLLAEHERIVRES